MSPTTRARAPQIALAANNAEIGGGEVMLLRIAEALRAIRLDVLVVGPAHPAGVLEAAERRGLRTLALPARGRLDYMVRLRLWRRRRRRLPLWCCGLVPSTATAGIGPRLVHLHSLPHGAQHAAAAAARIGARAVLVPSAFLGERVPGSTVLANWTDDPPRRSAPDDDGMLRIGFLGRLTPDKGVGVLTEALAQLPMLDDRKVRLVLAGETRFGTGQDAQIIEEALARLDGRVERLGWVERGAFFDAVDLAVFPSIMQETFGLVAAEAMAAGVPFVVSDAGALPEVVGPEHPWIARAGDAEDLGRTIRRAVLASTEERELALASARDRWRTHFSPAAGRRRVALLLEGLSGEAAANGNNPSTASTGGSRRA